MFAAFGRELSEKRLNKIDLEILLNDYLCMALSHEDLLLIESVQPTESIDDINARVNAAYRQVANWLHPQRAQQLGLSAELCEKGATALAAVNLAKERLSTLDNIREDRCATKNFSIYYLQGEVLKPYYPIFNNTIELGFDEAKTIFSAAELQLIANNRKAQRRNAELSKRADELKSLASDQERAYQNLVDLFNVDKVNQLKQRIDVLAEKIAEHEGIDNSSISDEMERIRLEFSRFDSMSLGLTMGANPNPSYQLIKNNKDLEEKFDNNVLTPFSKLARIERARYDEIRNNYLDKVEAAAQLAAPSGLRLRVVSGANSAQYDVLEDDDLKPVNPGPGFWKRHRNKFIIAGVGLLALAVVAVLGVFCAPALAALPFFAKASFGLFMTTGFLVSSKVIIGSVIAGAAVVTGGIAAGITAAVIAVREKFFGKKQAPDAGPDVAEVHAPSIRRSESRNTVVSTPNLSPRGKPVQYQTDPKAALNRSGQFGTAGRSVSSSDSAPKEESKSSLGFNAD